MMKKIFVYIIVVFMLINFTGCVKTEESTKVNSKGPNLESDSTKSDNKELSQENFPLNDTNVFDPNTIKIGDIVEDLKLTDIKFTKATEEYPLDTVVASFKGETTITGTVRYIFGDTEFIEDRVIFIVTGENIKDLPISHHDTDVYENDRLIIFINNQEYIKRHFKIEAGQMIEDVTIKIKNYRYIYVPSDATSTATFVMEVSE